MGIHLAQPATQFEAICDVWEILEPPQPRAPSQTPVRSKKRKAADQHAGGAHTLPHSQAQDIAQAPAPQTNTPDRGEINAFLKEALTTALQGNEELRQMLHEHEHVAMNASARIDEISAETDVTMASTRYLSSQFQHMAQKFCGPGQIRLSNLAVLKEGLRPGTSTPPTRRAETAVEGISATTTSSTPSCSTPWPSLESSPAVPHRGQSGAPPMNLQTSVRG